MNSLNCSLLVHTFNRYEFLWDGFLESKHLLPKGMPWYFGTDTLGHGLHYFDNFRLLYSGDDEWSDRLINLLNQIPTEYIFYIQEDQWPKEQIQLPMFLYLMEANKLSRLQISPVNQFYSLHGSSLPLYFHYKSKYLVSHQPSIWKKSFLLDCLKPNENPWVNEYEGTKRLNVPETAGKIAIYPCDWYKHKCENGKFID